LQTLGERGVRMPADLSLIGYDDMEWWTLTHPPLTTVGQPVYELGREAMRLLLAQIQAPGRRRPQRVVLKPELLTRASCGPPRASTSNAPRRGAGLPRQTRASR
jgi:LacI family transcriptional regulator